MRRICLPALAVLVLCSAVLAAKPKAKASRPASQPVSRPAARVLTMRGVVFEDLNSDGIRNNNEPPVAGMPVSDGLTITMSPDDGCFEFRLQESVRGSVFVCTPAGWRASKQFYVIAEFGRYADDVQPADIGLVRDPARQTDRFTFVQLSDTHVTDNASTLQTMTDDLQVAGRVSETPAFIVTTGDLTNDGKEAAQLAGYAKTVQTSRAAVYNVVGNHDYGGTLRDTENYEKYLGPPYYSFDIGPYHFIAKDVIGQKKNEKFYVHQQKWLDEDIRLNGTGKRIVVFQHYIPKISELDWWAQHDTAAVFSGHWHGRRERLYKGILDVNTSTTRFGGIDRSPRGFRLIHVHGQQLRCEWRVGGQHERVEIVHPPVDGTVAGRDVLIRAVAYDTAVCAVRARWRVLSELSGSAAIAQGELWAEGSWSWVGRWQAPPSLPSGRLQLQVEVTAADGRTWSRQGAFTLVDAPVPTVKPGEDWPFFHNDAGHRGYLPKGPRPPLALAWATHIGGTIHISSPVIADGRVYAASSFDQTLDDCAVTSLDLRTGKPLWRAPIDSSIKHSLAAFRGSIMAVSQAGTLYSLNTDGFPRWTASLDRGHDDRWELSFPVTDGKTVYAGRSTGFGAYDFATGAPLWTKPGGADWWPNIYSGPSLGTGTVYQGGPFVRALDPAKGDILWENTQMAVSTVAVVPAAVERDGDSDRLYVFHNQKTLRCLDGKTGKEIWRGTFEKTDRPDSEIVPLGNETGTPAVGEDIVCVGSAEVSKGELRGAAMHGFDKTTGKLRWRFPVGRELSPTVPYMRESTTITSSPVIVGNVVYFGGTDGYLYALDARDGHAIWKLWFGQPIASTVAASGNAIIVATWDGTIHALSSGE